MAEIQEVFEDFGDNAKKLIKNKYFLAALAVVGVAALYVAWKKSQTETAGMGGGDSAGYAYTGYPYVSEGGGDESYYAGNDSYYEELLTEMGNSYTAELDEVQSEYDASISTMMDELSASKEQTATALELLERQNAISQMRANSELYNNISDPSTKEALHAENLAIADKYGFEFDSKSGNYFDGNGVVYTTSKQQANIVEGKKTSSGGSGSPVSFQNNVDYQAEINKAIMGGASAETINKLNAQRDAKISATGMTTEKANSYYVQDVDYTTLINNAKKAGASEAVISNLTAQRNAKIAATTK